MAVDTGTAMNVVAQIASFIISTLTTLKNAIFGLFPGNEIFVALLLSLVLAWLIVRSRMTDLLLGLVIFLIAFTMLMAL